MELSLLAGHPMQRSSSPATTLRVTGTSLLLAIVTGCGGPVGEQVPLGSPTPSFAGSEACAECHATEYLAWRLSHHRQAMQPADADTVLGDFADARVAHAGITSVFTRADGVYAVTTDGPDGQMATYDIRYTFGVEPLQQYLLELGGGRLQAFPIAWDTRPAAAGGQRWFHLYPDERLRAGDPLHWTGIQQNWNFMCADCHSTNLRKGYDAATRTYATTWSEISVGCEACHGPASNHVAWAHAAPESRAASRDQGLNPRLDERAGVTWTLDQASGQPRRSVPRATDREIQVCARCHGRRSQLTDEVTAASDLHDGFRMALLEPGLYFPDGQMRDEVFNYGSFLQSRMHAAGVTCADCHEPHGGGLRAEGNAVCAQCHAPATYDATEHHFHPAASAGARCAACHMPLRTYMVVDPRHDHSFRIPRPDRTLTLGTPNVCTDCHGDRDAAWAAAEIARRYPAPRQGFQSFAEAFAGHEARQAGSAEAVLALAGDHDQPAIVRASAWRRLAGTAVAADAALVALRDPSPLVRAAAAEFLGAGTPAAYINQLLPLLDDPRLVVRLEAVAALLPVSPDLLPPGRLTAALTEYEGVQRFNADRPEGQANLADLLAYQGDAQGAMSAFDEALRLDPTYLPAWVNLADLHRRRGDEAAAERVLRAALPVAGPSGSAHYALALTLVRQQRLAEALPLLAEAARREPASSRFQLVWALALAETGQREQARRVLLAALALHPGDPELTAALAPLDR